MASRSSSGTTPRSKKTSTRNLPPVITVNNQGQAQPGGEDRAAEGVVGESSTRDVQVTGTTLQERELPSLSPSREARIAEAAYWRAERRGFAPGHELDDWLSAEREVDEASSQESRM